MSGRVHEYPGVGSPDRFDEIVNRGSAMRRRRRFLSATGAGVTGLACLALVVGLGMNVGSKADRSVVADRDTKSSQSANAPDTNTPVTPHDPIPAFLNVEPSDSDLTIQLNDQRTAVPADSDAMLPSSLSSQQCVTVTLSDESDATVAEGSACRQVGIGVGYGDESAVRVELNRTDGVSVGCAAVAQRLESPLTLRFEPIGTTFVAALPADLPPGAYTATVIGVSGFGDGCNGGSTQVEENPPPTDKTEQIEDDAQLKNSAVVERRFTVH